MRPGALAVFDEDEEQKEKMLVDVEVDVVDVGAIPRHGEVGVVVEVVGEEGVDRVEHAGGRKLTDASLHWCCCDGEGVHLASRLRIFSLCHFAARVVADGIPMAGLGDGVGHVLEAGS